MYKVKISLCGQYFYSVFRISIVSYICIWNVFFQKEKSNFYGWCIRSVVRGETSQLDFMSLWAHFFSLLIWIVRLFSLVFVNENQVASYFLSLQEPLTLSSSLLFLLNTISGIVILTATPWNASNCRTVIPTKFQQPLQCWKRFSPNTVLQLNESQLKARWHMSCDYAFS